MKQNVLFTCSLIGASYFIGIVAKCPMCKFYIGIVGSEKEIKLGKKKPTRFNYRFVNLHDDNLIRQIPPCQCDDCNSTIRARTAAPSRLSEGR
jgi:hypothetical protein